MDYDKYISTFNTSSELTDISGKKFNKTTLRTNISPAIELLISMADYNFLENIKFEEEMYKNNFELYKKMIEYLIEKKYIKKDKTITEIGAKVIIYILGKLMPTKLKKVYYKGNILKNYSLEKNKIRTKYFDKDNYLIPHFVMPKGKFTPLAHQLLLMAGVRHPRRSPEHHDGHARYLCSLKLTLPSGELTSKGKMVVGILLYRMWMVRLTPQTKKGADISIKGFFKC